jgi:hypothetical protein
MIFMKRPKRKDVLTEIKCPACEGTGLSKVTNRSSQGAKSIHLPAKNALARDELNRRALEDAGVEIIPARIALVCGWQASDVSST